MYNYALYMHKCSVKYLEIDSQDAIIVKREDKLVLRDPYDVK